MQMPAQIQVNGEPREIAGAPSVRDLLAVLGRDPDQPGVAVALNEAVVRRAAWPETAVREGDRVEIITASQGG